MRMRIHMHIHAHTHVQTCANIRKYACNCSHTYEHVSASKPIRVRYRSAIKRAYKKFALKYHPDKNPDACLEEAALLTDL